VLEADSLEGLDADIAARLAQALGLEAGQFRLTIQDQRSLTRNQEIAVERLRDRVAEALAPPPPPRRPTRPTRAARRQRLDEKTRRGSVKRLRQSPVNDNG
jgi:ribosome-associated protein